MENEVIVTDKRDAEVVTAPKANLSLLSNEPWLQENVNTFEPKKEEAKTTEVIEKKNEEEIKVTGELEVTKTPEEIEADKLAETAKLEEKPLTIEETPLTIEADKDEIPEDSWLALAKSKNLEIAEDTLEAYEAAVTAPLLAQIEQAKTAKVEDYLAEIDPQIRMEIELNKAGLSYEDIKAPLENIARYRSMNPVELVREDLTLKISNIRELTDEDKAFIDAEIEKKVESGEINHDHKRLMLVLDESEKQVKDEQQSIIDRYKINNAKQLEEKRSNEIASVSKALSETPSFMGSVVAKESLEAMAKKYSDGKYDHILNDPAKKAEFIMYHELGKKAYDAAIAKSKAEGHLKVVKELHNTPPVDKLGAGVSTTTHETKTGLQKLKDEPGLKY